jgi:hypothetical protein
VDGDAVVIFRGDFPVGHTLPRILNVIILTVPRYVAMHAMQEEAPHEHSASNGYVESPIAQRKQAKPRMRDTFAAVGGMLIPILTQIGHH